MLPVMICSTFKNVKYNAKNISFVHFVLKAFTRVYVNVAEGLFFFVLLWKQGQIMKICHSDKAKNVNK